MYEYGPQTEEIKKFLDKARNMTPEQIEELGVIYDTAWNAAWNSNAAWNAAWDAAEDDSWNVVWHAVWKAAWRAVRDDVWHAVSDAVLDISRSAVLALVVKDKISEEHFNTLYGPWKSVMEN